MLIAPTKQISRTETINVVDPCLTPDWDREISGFKDSSFFHTSAWARVLEETYKFKSSYVVSKSEGKMRSVIPLVEIESRLTGKRAITLPFSDRCEILGSTETRKEIIQGLASWKAGAENNLDQWNLILNSGLASGWKFYECRDGDVSSGPFPSQIYLQHTLDLTPGIRALEAKLSSSHKRAIRKAEGQGLVVKFGTSLTATQEYYRLHCLTRKEHGIPPQPFSFFESLYKNVLQRDRGFIALAADEEGSVAGALFVYFQDRALFKFGASHPDKLNYRANNLVMWASIKHLAQAGFGSLNFGRTSPDNLGLRRFKNGWGTVEEPLHYCRYDFRRHGFVQGSSKEHGLHTRLFRFMPLSLARMAGKALYRHIA